MDLLANRDRSIPLESACEMLGILRSTVQRLLAPHVRGPRKLRPSSPRKLSEAEAQMVFDTLYSARIRDGLRTRSTRSSWTRAQKSARPARRTAAWGLTATRAVSRKLSPESSCQLENRDSMLVGFNATAPIGVQLRV
jgi:hypothetical protein